MCVCGCVGVCVGSGSANTGRVQIPVDTLVDTGRGLRKYTNVSGIYRVSMPPVASQMPVDTWLIPVPARYRQIRVYIAYLSRLDPKLRRRGPPFFERGSPAGGLINEPQGEP